MLVISLEVSVSYDKNNDILFIRFITNKKQADIDEPVEGVIVYLAQDGTVLGFEIWDAKKRGIIDALKEAISE